MGTLNSKLFTEGDPAVAKMLENCANGHPTQVQSHFSKTDNRSGEHIRKVQTALQQIQESEPALNIPRFEVNGVYDAAFALAVAAYKRGRSIRNFADRIDDVIGIKTIRQMDDDIAQSPQPEPRPLPRVPADIVVRFQGARVEGMLKPDEVLITRLIQIYRPKPDQPFNNEIMIHPFSNRLLVRLGRKTTTIGAASTSMFASISFHLTALMGVLHAKPDRIYIHGSSSGGRNAIDFAASISRLGLRPSLVASVDAAFFHSDATTRPVATIPPQPEISPEFIVDAGSTPPQRRFNWYQTLGNHVKATAFKGLMFTSDMAGEEIHGTIRGFNNIKVDRFLPNPLTLTDDGRHEECCRFGIPEAQRMIAADILQGRP